METTFTEAQEVLHEQGPDAIELSSEESDVIYSEVTDESDEFSEELSEVSSSDDEAADSGSRALFK